MRTAIWRGVGITALVVGFAFGAAPLPLAAADGPSASIEIDAVSVVRPTLPFFWTYPSLNGTFEARGDVEDEGTAGAAFYMTGWGWWGGLAPQSYWLFTLYGENGTLSLTLHIQTGNWMVTGGTGDYADATGGGTSACETSVSGYVTSYVYTLSGSVDA